MFKLNPLDFPVNVKVGMLKSKQRCKLGRQRRLGCLYGLMEVKAEVIFDNVEQGCDSPRFAGMHVNAAEHLECVGRF